MLIFSGMNSWYGLTQIMMSSTEQNWMEVYKKYLWIEISMLLVSRLSNSLRMFIACEFPDDLAVDWVSSNVYWVDAAWARIEVIDLRRRYRAEVLRTGPNTYPRAIAVEPYMRYDRVDPKIRAS